MRRKVKIEIISGEEMKEKYGYTKEDMLEDLKVYDRELYEEFKNED